MSLHHGIQVVLQQPRKNGGSTCRAFTGLPHLMPAWFCVEPLHPADSSTASDVGDAIAAGLISLGSSVHEVAPPCGGCGFGSCHAESVPDCAKVLLPFVGATGGSSPLLTRWSNFGATARICPVLDPSASVAAMPKCLKGINGVQWSPGDPGAIGKILQLGGLVSVRPRLFISYVRAESQALAEQLHDYLNRLGFEVFLDRFSVEPGTDFQVRLTEELSRMGTLLVLESESILKSRWVRHEIQFARSCRLGLIGLHLPKGKFVPGISHDSRLPIVSSQQNGKGRLFPKHLKDVGLRLQALHAAAERIRIAYLRDTMSDALLLNGFSSQGFDVGGVIVAKKNTNEYSFAVRNLPPEMADFHAVEGHRAQGRSTFVVAPSKYMDWQTRRSLSWLSQETHIGLEDEGDMLKLARRLP